MTDNSSDLSDDIVPEVPRHASVERHFEPWHKVRKEFIRREQWSKLVIQYARRFLVRELQQETESEWSVDGRSADVPDAIEISNPLKCLVIPGDDLLDIRALERDTESIKCYIRYLGFNESHGSNQLGTRVHIAHNDVTSSSRISNRSRVLHDRFQAVAKQNSQAYQYVKDLGPFHVVNLDLCDSLFPTKTGDLRSYYEALHRICEFQMKEMATPWLMFITTETAPREVDAAQLDMLCSPTKCNMNAHAEFAAAFASVVPTSAMSSPIDCSQLDEKQLVDLFGVAIGKALLSFCSSAEPKWKVTMLGSHIYSLNKELCVSMLSLAFVFIPVNRPPLDMTGLSSISSAARAPFDECAMATKLVLAVQRITNIDALLSDNVQLYAELRESSANLLESAGYNRNDYLRWVDSGEPTTMG